MNRAYSQTTNKDQNNTGKLHPSSRKANFIWTKKNLIFLIFNFALSSLVLSQEKPAFLKFTNDPWVTSTFEKMNLDEKIGQLFIVQAYSKDTSYSESVLADIEKYHVGGIIFMEGKPTTQARLTNRFQKASAIPLLIATDAEYGLGFRMDSTLKYPTSMALGALQNDALIYQMGKEIGKQCRRMGIHLNFAPVADLNSNPNNPVIGFRSFGEDINMVSHKAQLYAQGMQDMGVLACAKHFPGHGDTDTDSHLTLPSVAHTETYIDSVFLTPFRHLINHGIASVMTAHLQIPSLEKDTQIPSSLSSNIIQHKLKEELGFEGLVITDGMNMHAVSKRFKPGDAAVKALQAGNDIIEITPDLKRAIASIKQAINKGILSEESINQKCLKILAAKRWLGLNKYTPIDLKAIDESLNNKKYEVTLRNLHQQSITVLTNQQQLLPLMRLDTLKTATLSIGTDSISAFQQMAANYQPMEHFYLRANAETSEINKVLNELKNYNLILAGMHGMKLSASKNYGLSDQQIAIAEQLDLSKTIVCWFGNPYALNHLPRIGQARALVVTYQENETTQELAAQGIYGAVELNGRLPVNVSEQFAINSGQNVKKIDRLAYSFPEHTGINSSLLQHKIDSLALAGLNAKAYPGCQILIAKDGEVIFHKCYGYYTFDNIKPVTRESIYDLASVSKISSALPAIMKLHGEGKINLDRPFSDYWTAFKGSDKEAISFRDILAHQGQLTPFIPFYRKTLKKNGKLQTSVFRKRPSKQFDVRISSGLYQNRDYIQHIYNEIRNTPKLKKKEYVYSDLGFMIFPEVVKSVSGDPDYEHYLKTNFYAPLGAGTISYNPHRFFPIEEFIPTEYDDYFRKEQMQGFVHDEGAAMLGGVSGNAGLFSTVNDIAKLMQMYMQFGYYGGHQYIDSLTMKEFQRRQFPENNNRRGLGFDKPLIDNHKNALKDAYPAIDASKNSFGHSGFTGTFVWADPDNKLLFIYFTNRVYPTRQNSIMFDLNLRPQLHQAIYDCIRIGNH